MVEGMQTLWIPTGYTCEYLLSFAILGQAKLISIFVVSAVGGGKDSVHEPQKTEY